MESAKETFAECEVGVTGEAVAVPKQDLIGFRTFVRYSRGRAFVRGASRKIPA